VKSNDINIIIKAQAIENIQNRKVGNKGKANEANTA
jgi:hypothetical protein